jgi:cation:H+ antiporter
LRLGQRPAVVARDQCEAARRARPVGTHRPRAEEFGDVSKLHRDQLWFLAIFVVKVGLGLVAFAVKPWLGLAFFAAYGVYFWREIRAGGEYGDAEELAPLLIQRKAKDNPAAWAIVVQTLVTLAVIFAASQLFVGQLAAVGPMIGLPATVTALLLSPMATELPETMNALIWVRQGKTQLALANISGAMMIQATVPSTAMTHRGRCFGVQPTRHHAGVAGKKGCGMPLAT